MASTVPPLISKLDPSISEEPAVNFPPRVNASIFAAVRVAKRKSVYASSEISFPPPVLFVVNNANSSADSSHTNATFVSSPRSITNPASSVALPLKSLFIKNKLSAICKVVVSTVVVVPEIVRLPGIEIVVPLAPIVKVLAAMVSKIVLLPTAISKSVIPVIVPPTTVAVLMAGLVKVLAVKV